MHNELVRELFVTQNKSCSEAVFLAAVEIFGLSAGEGTLKAVGAFSGGICSERLCGAAAGAVCAIGLKYNTGSAHSSPEMREKCAAFMKEFIGFYGSDLCTVLKPLYRKSDVRCLSIVEQTISILEKYM